MAVSARQCDSSPVTPCECTKNKTPAYNLPSMARILRFLLACIVMFAVPVQGFASTTMLLCGGGAAHHASVADIRNVSDPTFVGHDHAKHGHDTQKGHSPEMKAGDTSGQSDSKASSSNVAHKCGACASCCHLVAISETAQAVLAVPLPQSTLSQPAVHVASLPAIVPDKPPRA